MSSLLRVVWLAGVVLCCVPVQAQVVLRYRFEKDKPLYYESVSKQEQKAEVLGQTITVNQETRVVNRWSLQKTTDSGEFLLENKSLLVQFVQTQKLPIGERTFRFDSTKPDPAIENPLEKILLQTLKNTARMRIVLRMDSRGRVSQMEGVEKIFQGVEVPGVAQKLVKGLVSEAQKQRKSQLFVLPEKPLQVGDQWEEPFEIKLPQLGVFKGKIVYRLEEVKNGVARIGVKSTLEGKTTLQPAPGVRIASTAKTTRTQGHALFDIQRGRIIASEQDLEMQIDGTITVQDREQQFKQTLNVKKTFRLLDSPPKLPEPSSEQTEE